MNSGVYIAVFYLAEVRDISVGKLGRFRFREGFYFYAGSAQRNLDARLERHGRKCKPMRWHIDYLSVHADMLGAIIIAGPREAECETAAQLGAMFETAAPGFGASDCRCRGHLFYTPRLHSASVIPSEVEESGRQLYGAVRSRPDSSATRCCAPLRSE